MRVRRRSLREALGRAVVLPALLFGVVLCYSVPAHVLAVRLGWWSAHAAYVVQPTAQAPQWTPRHSRLFPDCVASHAWPADEVPSALVVVRRSGEVAAMGLDELFTRSRSASRADDVWTVGACR